MKFDPKKHHRPFGNAQGRKEWQSLGIAPTTLSLPEVVKRYIEGVYQNAWQPFNGKLWKRNYYEHIIRDENDLGRIREYIIENPINGRTINNMKLLPVFWKIK